MNRNHIFPIGRAFQGQKKPFVCLKNGTRYYFVWFFFLCSDLGPDVRDLPEEERVGVAVPLQRGGLRQQHGRRPVFPTTGQLPAHSRRGLERRQLGSGKGPPQKRADQFFV